MKNKIYKKFKGFTLAEILLSMMILGVIAAATIPGLLMHMQKSETVTGMKKAYSTLSNAVTKFDNENYVTGYVKFWDTDDELFEGIAKQINTDVVCAKGATGCFTEKPLKTLNNSDVGTYNGKDYTFRGADGMCYQFSIGADTASSMGLSSEDAAKAIGTFAVDVNGDTGPNKIGRDVFFYVFVEGKGIVPAGYDNHSDCKPDGQGYGCAGRLMKEGKMKY